MIQVHPNYKGESFLSCGGEMTSTDTLGRLHRLCTRQFPSTGGELAGTEPTRPPRQAELDTPPQEGNCRSTGGELASTELTRPPRQAELDTPPQEGNCRSTGGELAGTEPTRPPRQAELDTPPQEGNCRPYCRGPSKNTLTRILIPSISSTRKVSV